MGDPTSGRKLGYVGEIIDQLLAIIGHFDDPAAASCSRAFVGEEASSLVPEEGSVQVLRCRENFVVTGFNVRP